MEYINRVLDLIIFVHSIIEREGDDKACIKYRLVSDIINYYHFKIIRFYRYNDALIKARSLYMYNSFDKNTKNKLFIIYSKILCMFFFLSMHFSEGIVILI